MMRVAVADVEEVGPQKQSLMPDLLLRSLTAQQAADLLEYLATLKNEWREPRSPVSGEWRVASGEWRVASWMNSIPFPIARHDSRVSAEVAVCPGLGLQLL